MDTPLSRAHNLIQSVINSGGTVSKYWLEDAAEVLAKDGGLTPVAADFEACPADHAKLQAMRLAPKFCPARGVRLQSR